MSGIYLFFVGALLNWNNPTAGNEGLQPKGIYGGDGKNAPSLQLNENHTFIYTDLTKPSKPVISEGTWSIEADELILQTSGKNKLNKHYTLIREGKCIKTRKKMAFYTLCNCN